jgi:hypothetical protein
MKNHFPSKIYHGTCSLGEVTADVGNHSLESRSAGKKRVLINLAAVGRSNNTVVTVTIKDISKYKQMEEDLKESESKYRQLIGFRKDTDTML